MLSLKSFLNTSGPLIQILAAIAYLVGTILVAISIEPYKPEYKDILCPWGFERVSSGGVYALTSWVLL